MKLSAQNILLGMIGLAVAGLLTWSFLPTAVEADLGHVSRGRLRVTVDEDGKTRIRDRYIVSAPLTGRLQRVQLRPGDALRAGKSVLATIEPRDPELLDSSARAQAEARVKAAEAARDRTGPELERAKAAHELAITERKRAERLLPVRSVSEQDYEAAASRERVTAEELRSARFAARVTEYELEVARAALIRTRPTSPGEAAADRFDLLSPIEGSVLRVFQESSTVVTPGTRLLEIGDPADLEVEVDVLSADAVRIRPGAPVEFEHWGGSQPLQGRVRRVEPAAFTKTSALGVEEQRVWTLIDFVDPPTKREALGDAYRVEARIVVWEGADVLKVPAGALFRRGDDWAVFAVVNGRASLRILRVGHGNGLETEVLEGLAEGDPVVVHPSDRIRDGVAVTAR